MASPHNTAGSPVTRCIRATSASQSARRSSPSTLAMKPATLALVGLVLFPLLISPPRAGADPPSPAQGNRSIPHPAGRRIRRLGELGQERRHDRLQHLFARGHAFLLVGIGHVV